MNAQKAYEKLVNKDDVPPALAWWGIYGDNVYTHLNYMCISESEWRKLSQEEKESDFIHEPLV